MDDDVPLARLLAAGLRLVVDAMHEQLAAGGHPGLRPAHGFALNAVGAAGATTTEVGALLGMTKQGAAKLVQSLVDTGYLRRRPHPGDARAQLLVLTARGKQALRLAATAQHGIEQQLQDKLGEADVQALRRVLRRLHEEGEGIPALRPVW